MESESQSEVPQSDLSQQPPAMRLQPNNKKKNTLLLKLSTIFSGLVGTVLILATIKLAIYYESVCLSINSQGGNHHGPNGHLASCEERTPFSYDRCDFIYQQTERELNAAAPSTRLFIETDYLEEYRRPDCPSKWLVEPPAYIMAVTWGVITTVLVATLLKSRKPTRANDECHLDQCDFGCLWAYGVTFLCCTFSLLIFFFWLSSSDYWCSGHNTTSKYAWNYPYYNKNSNQSVAVKSMVRGYQEGDNYNVQTCADINRLVYQPWLLIFGTLSAGVSGVLAIVTTNRLKMLTVMPSMQSSMLLGSYKSSSILSVVPVRPPRLKHQPKIDGKK